MIVFQTNRLRHAYTCLEFNLHTLSSRIFAIEISLTVHLYIVSRYSRHTGARFELLCKKTVIWSFEI